MQRVEAGRNCAIVRVDGQWLAASAPSAVVRASGPDAFAALRQIAAGGFWVGFLTYDLGRSIEHIEPHAPDDLGLPDVINRAVVGFQLDAGVGASDDDVAFMDLIAQLEQGSRAVFSADEYFALKCYDFTDNAC